MTDQHRHRWRVPPGVRPRLDSIATSSTDGAPGDKAVTGAASGELVETLADLQSRLWAEDSRSLLLVLQAMDAAGKDGTIRKVFTGVNPQGVKVASFKTPSTKELSHDFLWRVHREVPEKGEIGVFNRSHYEDVLIARVDELVPEPVWRDRYQRIRDFEAHLVASGTSIVKVFLHISAEEQKARFEARWKFSQADLEVRRKWHAYQEAYTDAIAETSTDGAPWYVVPADRKWFRDWAVLRILVETLRDLDPQYPDAQSGIEGCVVPDVEPPEG
jgi:PPK2 family polyphosphate:nucleotide phosphotransferase